MANKPEKRERVRWRVDRKGKPLGFTQTDQGADRARDNVWYGKFRKNASREEMAEAKRIYHNEITARPAMIQPHRRFKLRKAKARPGQDKLAFMALDKVIKVEAKIKTAGKKPRQRKPRAKAPAWKQANLFRR